MTEHEDLSRGSRYSESPPRDIPFPRTDHHGGIGGASGSAASSGFSDSDAWAFSGGPRQGEAGADGVSDASFVTSQSQPPFDPASFGFDPNFFASHNPPPSSSDPFAASGAGQGHYRTPSDVSSVSAAASPFLNPLVPGSPALSSSSRSAYSSSHSHVASPAGTSNFVDEPLPMEMEGGFASLGLDRRASSASAASVHDVDPGASSRVNEAGSDQPRGSTFGSGFPTLGLADRSQQRYDTLSWARDNDTSRQDTIMANTGQSGSTTRTASGVQDGSSLFRRSEEGGDAQRKRILSTGGLKPKISVSSLTAALEDQQRRERDKVERQKRGSGGSDDMFVASPTESPTGLNAPPFPLVSDSGSPGPASGTSPGPVAPSINIRTSTLPAPPPGVSEARRKKASSGSATSPPLKLDVSVGPSISLTSATPSTARPGKTGTMEFQKVMEELSKGRRDAELGLAQGGLASRTDEKRRSSIGEGSAGGRSRSGSASGEPRKSLSPSAGQASVTGQTSISATDFLGVDGRKMPIRKRSKSDPYSTAAAAAQLQQQQAQAFQQAAADQLALMNMFAAANGQGGVWAGAGGSTTTGLEGFGFPTGTTGSAAGEVPTSAAPTYDDAMAANFMPVSSMTAAPSMPSWPPPWLPAGTPFPGLQQPTGAANQGQSVDPQHQAAMVQQMLASMSAIQQQQPQPQLVYDPTTGMMGLSSASMSAAAVSAAAAMGGFYPGAGMMWPPPMFPLPPNVDPATSTVDPRGVMPQASSAAWPNGWPPAWTGSTGTSYPPTNASSVSPEPEMAQEASAAGPSRDRSRSPSGLGHHRRSVGGPGYDASFLSPATAAGASGLRRSHSAGHGHRRGRSDGAISNAPDPSAFMTAFMQNGMLGVPTSAAGQLPGPGPPDAFGNPPYGSAQPSAFPGYGSPTYSASSPSALSAASGSEYHSSAEAASLRNRSWSHSSLGSYASDDDRSGDYSHAGPSSGGGQMSSFGFGGPPGSASPGTSPGRLDVHSKTTEATKAAAKKRRKEGTEARYVCELCGETFTRRYNLKGASALAFSLVLRSRC